MKKGGGGTACPASSMRRSNRPWRLRQVPRRFHCWPAQVSWLGLAWLSLRTASWKSPRPRTRKPARPRRNPDPRRRCVGTFLLHRLSQRASEIPWKPSSTISSTGITSSSCTKRLQSKRCFLPAGNRPGACAGPFVMRAVFNGHSPRFSTRPPPRGAEPHSPAIPQSTPASAGCLRRRK